MESVEELKKICFKLNETQSTIKRIIYRKYSYYFTWFFLKLKMTANQVTAFGFTVGIVAAVFFTTNNYALFMVGSILLFISFMSDFADGSVARYRIYKELPDELLREYGSFFDSLLNYPRNFVILCMSLSFLNLANPVLILFVGFTSAIFCFLDVGFNGLLNVAFHKRITHRKSIVARKLRYLVYDQALFPLFLFITSAVDLIMDMHATFGLWIFMASCGICIFVLEILAEIKSDGIGK